MHWICVTVVTVTVLACHLADGKFTPGKGVSASNYRKDISQGAWTKTKKWNAKQFGNRRYDSVKDKPSRRLLGGDHVEIKKHPYAATILIHGHLWCAGAIVHTRWVLTAAHCVSYVLVVRPPLFLDYIKLRVESTKATHGGTVYNVTLVVRHPNYELEPPPHADVAMLKTASDIVFNADVMPIRIYRGVEEPYAQNFITTVGWGAKSSSVNAFKDKSTHMTDARLKVRTMEYCELAYQRVVGLTITKDFFCASLRNGTRDACLFDAGAPAVQDNMLMGIMSFGPESCGDETKPAVFIRAWKFRPFVKTTILNNRIDEVEDVYTTVSTDISNESSEFEEKLDYVTKRNESGTEEIVNKSESNEAKKGKSGEAKKTDFGEAKEGESSDAKMSESVGDAKVGASGEAEKTDSGDAKDGESGEAKKAESGEAEKGELSEPKESASGEAKKAESGEAKQD